MTLSCSINHLKAIWVSLLAYLPAIFFTHRITDEMSLGQGRIGAQGDPFLSQEPIKLLLIYQAVIFDLVSDNLSPHVEGGTHLSAIEVADADKSRVAAFLGFHQLTYRLLDRNTRIGQ